MAVAEAAAASKGYYAAPFTNAQWEELERQAMIYKYMVASIPVPPDLLFANPFHNINNNNPSIVNPFGDGGGVGGCGGGLKLRLSNSTDPEPGRCRRTDGKKWRCSRDAAAGHRYCERHMHRGRPRSRKPVEIHHNTRKEQTRHVNHALPSYSTTITTTTSELNNNSDSRSSDQWKNLGYNQTPLFLNKTPVFDSIPSSVSSHKEHRSLEWLMSGEAINEPFNQIRNRDSASFLNQTSKNYVDAWSKTVADEQSSVSLTLSMGDHAMGPPIHMGLNLRPVESVKEHNHHDQHHEGGGGNKSLISSWASPSSWVVSSTPGGPLAEALRPSSTAAGGDLSSPPITAVSSPSGVLQKTVASVSDSSGSSSPTTLASSCANKTECSVALQWLNQGS